MSTGFLGKNCPFCKMPFGEGDKIVVCSSCKTPHHLQCWQTNGGCTTAGCIGSIQNEIEALPLTDNAPEDTPSAGISSGTVQKPDASAKRYETISAEEPNKIQGGIPVLIEKTSLIIDRQSNSLTAVCFFRSLTDNPITGLLVDVNYTDAWGVPLGKVEGVQFLDLKTKRDSVFGQTQPVSIPNQSARSISVEIKKILYSDKTIADAEASQTVLPVQKTLEDFFGSRNLATEYRRETNDLAQYAVVSGGDYWRCACGTINSQSETICRRCGSNKDDLTALLDAEKITSNLAAYQEGLRLSAEQKKAAWEEQIRQAEEKKRLEQEELELRTREEAELRRTRQGKTKKVFKRIGIVALSVAVAAFLTYAVIYHGIPYIRYCNACKSLESQMFDEAYAAFTALGDFRDSTDKAMESLYQKGISLISSGSYTEAADTFERVPDYLDSQDQAVYCRNEAAYLEAESLLDAGSYKDAADIFARLSGYSDSATRANAANYLYAQELFKNGSYGEAGAVYKALGNYENSAAEYKKSMYRYAAVLAEGSDLKEASDIYRSLGDYEESAAQYQDTYYRYGLQLMEKKSYAEAVTVFTDLGDFQESTDKLTEAKYGYVLAHQDSSDKATYSYLTELKDAKYMDSAKIYASLYAWKATIVMNDSEYDSLTNKASISRFSRFFCHVTITGGPPDGTVQLKWKMIFPNGGTTNGWWDDDIKAGESGCCYGYYLYPSSGSAGTFRVKIYTRDTNELIGEASIQIT